MATLRHLLATQPYVFAPLCRQLNTTIRLPAYWELERRTVEKDAAP
jgi:hypothetical protein